jgi:hypothetical protein
MKTNDPSKLDRVLAEARRTAREREQSYCFLGIVIAMYYRDHGGFGRLRELRVAA